MLKQYIWSKNRMLVLEAITQCLDLLHDWYAYMSVHTCLCMQCACLSVCAVIYSIIIVGYSIRHYTVCQLCFRQVVVFIHVLDKCRALWGEPSRVTSTRQMQSITGRTLTSHQTLCIICALMNLVWNFVNSHNWISMCHELWIRVSTRMYICNADTHTQPTH